MLTGGILHLMMFFYCTLYDLYRLARITIHSRGLIAAEAQAAWGAVLKHDLLLSRWE